MQYEDLVEGYEDSMLAPLVAIGREARATARGLGLLGVAELLLCVAMMYVLMFAGCAWAAL